MSLRHEMLSGEAVPGSGEAWQGEDIGSGAFQSCSLRTGLLSSSDSVHLTIQRPAKLLLLQETVGSSRPVLNPSSLAVCLQAMAFPSEGPRGDPDIHVQARWAVCPSPSERCVAMQWLSGCEIPP